MNKVFSGRFIAVLIVTLLSLYFVGPTFKYFWFVNGLPESPSAEQLKKKREMLESKSMIKLGLDLQGGVDFLIAVDTEQMVQRDLDNLAESLRNDFRTDDVTAEVEVLREKNQIAVTLDDPVKDLNVARDIVQTFQGTTEWDDLGNLNGGILMLSQSEEHAQEAAKGAVDAALKTIRNRVDGYGLTQPVVVKQGLDRIRVQIPGETDPDRIRRGLLRTANMEFRLLHPEHDTVVVPFIEPGSVGVGGTGVIKAEYLEDYVVPETGRTIKRLKQNIPGVPAGYKVFLGVDSRTDAKGAKTSVENLVYILKDRPELTGESLRRANAITDTTDLRSPYKVSLEFDSRGREKFAEVTQDNVGRRFAIILDGVVNSAPEIIEPILYGSCQITGDFTPQDAHDLALVLKAGALPAPLKIIEDQAVGASLGQDSVVDSGKALVIGGIALIAFMVFVYHTAGVIAILAMFLNVLLILAVLSLAGATLTLSGIGGILLTMGMAVDANVLIYERLREELRDGKPIRAALNTAFGRAFAVIFDGNITSLLPALVLILFEIVEGSVKGFWVALGIGLIANLYTGMTVTRALMESWLAKKKSIGVGTIHFFRDAKWDFMGKRNIAYAFSGTLVVLSLVYMSFHGLNRGVDFTGGLLANVETSSVSRPDMEKALAKSFRDVKVVAVLNKDLLQVTIPKPDGDEGAELDIDAMKGTLTTVLQESFGDKVTVASLQGVESIVGDEFTVTAALTLVVASILILGYLGVRFQPIFGAGAVIAVLHDLIVSLGVFIFLGRSLTLDIVSALLIILGYSVNDTIVVFDRIRETMGEKYGRHMHEVINQAINMTLSRTLFTGGTTLIMILSMLLFGGVGLKDFALILFIGIGFGTYSSVFVASALVDSYMTAKEKREGVESIPGKTRTVKITG